MIVSLESIRSWSSTISVANKNASDAPQWQGLCQIKGITYPPTDWSLSEIPKRAMRGLGKRVKGLVEHPPSKITLRLRIVGVAPHIELVSAGAEQRRGEQLSDGVQQAHGEIDRRGRTSAAVPRADRSGTSSRAMPLGTRCGSGYDLEMAEVCPGMSISCDDVLH